MELIYNNKTDEWEAVPETYGTVACLTKEDYEYAKKAIKTHKKLEAKHWDECRQIAHYDNDIKSLREQIQSAKRPMIASLSTKQSNSDYLKGYISALSAVEGMIAEVLGE